MLPNASFLLQHSGPKHLSPTHMREHLTPHHYHRAHLHHTYPWHSRTAFREGPSNALRQAWDEKLKWEMRSQRGPLGQT